jgi:hypothetical protein
MGALAEGLPILDGSENASLIARADGGLLVRLFIERRSMSANAEPEPGCPGAT